MPSPSWPNAARFALGMTALSFLIIGAGFLVTPVSWAQSVDITLTTSMARTDFRATYGGFVLMFGVYLVLCALRPAWHAAGLLAGALTLGGFAVSRLLGLVLEGTLSSLMWTLLGVEVMAVAINTFLYIKRPAGNG